VASENGAQGRLDWPEGRPRTSAVARLIGTAENANTRAASYAVRRVQRALDRLGASATVVSSDLALGRGVESSGGGAEPDDPGACVRFRLGNQGFAIPCDRFATVSANLMAIARHIEATLALLDHGVVSAEEAFAAHACRERSRRQSWRAVFGNVQTADELAAAFRRLAQNHHPDRPSGSHDAMADLCRARDEALHDLQTASPEPAGDLETAVFESDKPFGAMRSAERFLEDRGFAFGAAQRGAPRGVLLGAYHIRKWGDLSDDEKAALDGQMTGDMRYGPVTVRIKRDALSRAQWARVSTPDKKLKPNRR
jgi:hypothetical protein